MKHPHAELMLQYAQDAMTTDKPWELWEHKSKYLSTEWESPYTHPRWDPECDYRRKPKKKQIKLLAYLTDNVMTYVRETVCTPPAWKRIPSEDKIIEIEE